MGLCHSKQLVKQQSLYTANAIDIQLDSFTSPSQVTEFSNKFRSQVILLYECVVDKLHKSVQLHFESEAMNAEQTITKYFKSYFKNQFFPFHNNELPIQYPLLENCTVKLILEVYLAVMDIRQKKEPWWSEEYFFIRKRAIESTFQTTPKCIDPCMYSPIINFILLLTKAVEQILRKLGFSVVSMKQDKQDEQQNENMENFFSELKQNL